MELERRCFLRAIGGLALGWANREVAFGQTSKGELEAGGATLHLEGKLQSVLLTLNAQDFLDRADHSVIVRGSLGSRKLYSAMFSYKYDSTVFALFHDTGHSTTVVLSDSEDAKIGRLVVWNDNQAPHIYSIDKNKIMEAEDLKDIVDVNGKRPNLVGKRAQAAFTWKDLESVFGSDPALQEFMRGKKSTHHPREEDKLLEWACRLLSIIPGSTLSLFWLGR
jgi:hypothetical protein